MKAVVVSEWETRRTFLKTFFDELRLEGLIHELTVVSLVTDAYAILATEPFDIVVIDLTTMGRKDGSETQSRAIELLRWCKQSGLFEKVVCLRPMGPNIIVDASPCCYLGECGYWGESRCQITPFVSVELRCKLEQLGFIK